MKAGASRWWAGLGLAAVAGAIGWLVVGGLEENMVYFLTPSELAARGPSVYGAPVRLGGQVVEGTVSWRSDSAGVSFRLTDGADTVSVRSEGAPPAMFRAGQGVVVEGEYGSGRVFRADRLMVKHSNEYRPPAGSGSMPERAYESLSPRGSSSASGAGPGSASASEEGG